MKLGDYVSLAVVAAIILAVVVARRRGKAAAANALAAAFARGEAHAKAEAAAISSSRVDVGGIHLGGSTQYGERDAELDAIVQAVIAARYGAADRPDNNDDNVAVEHYTPRSLGLPLRNDADRIFARVGSGHLSSESRRGTPPLLDDPRNVAADRAPDGTAHRHGVGTVNHEHMP